MCASYGALESTLVSTRSTVPETLASAAARTLDAVSPLSRVSVRPLTVWPPWDGSCAGGAPWVVGAAPCPVEDGDPEVAALAMAAALTAAVPTAAAVTSLERVLSMVLLRLGSESGQRGPP